MYMARVGLDISRREGLREFEVGSLRQGREEFEAGSQGVREGCRDLRQGRG